MAKYEDIEVPTGFKARPGHEYTAQCWGGPEHGNLLSASLPEWPYHQDSWMWTDGPERKATVVTVKGKYVYDHNLAGDGPLWVWQGPGADGNTIERLRLR